MKNENSTPAAVSALIRKESEDLSADDALAAFDRLADGEDDLLAQFDSLDDLDDAFGPEPHRVEDAPFVALDRLANDEFDRELQKVIDAEDRVRQKNRVSISQRGEVIRLTLRPRPNWGLFGVDRTLVWIAAFSVWSAVLIGFDSFLCSFCALALVMLLPTPWAVKSFVRGKRFLIHKEKKTFVQQYQTLRGWKSLKSGDLSELSIERVLGEERLNETEIEQLKIMLQDIQAPKMLES